MKDGGRMGKVVEWTLPQLTAKITVANDRAVETFSLLFRDLSACG